METDNMRFRYIVIGAFMCVLFLAGCGKNEAELNENVVPKDLETHVHELDKDNICDICNEKCVKYTYGKTMYVGPENTNKDFVTVNMTDADGKVHIYKVHYQKKGTFDTYNEYLDLHGCAALTLTTLLNEKISSLASYTPGMTISTIEKEVIDPEVYEKNYSRDIEKQQPITLFGMSKIFDKHEIEHEYVNSFDEESAVKQIKKNLKKGKAVVFVARKTKDDKWTTFAHVMLMIGLNDDGEAIVCDTNNRDWAGDNQRIKYAPVEELIQYMNSESEEPTRVYWGKGTGKNGYILLK